MENYFGDVLQSFSNGVQMDLRLKLAIEFLKSDAVPDDTYIDPNVELQQRAIGQPPLIVRLTAAGKARYALDLAEALLDQAAKLGLLKPLPEDDGLSSVMRKHLRRNARAQAFMQVVGPELAQDEQPKVALGVNGPLPAGRRQ